MADEKQEEAKVRDKIAKLAPQANVVRGYMRLGEPEVQQKKIYGENGHFESHARAVVETAEREDADWKDALAQFLYTGRTDESTDAKNFKEMVELVTSEDDENQYMSLVSQFVERDIGYSQETTGRLIGAFKEGDVQEMNRAMKAALDEATDGSIIQARRQRMLERAKTAPLGSGAAAAIQYLRDEYGVIPKEAKTLFINGAGDPTRTIQAAEEIAGLYRNREALENRLENTTSTLGETIDEVVEEE